MEIILAQLAAKFKYGSDVALTQKYYHWEIGEPSDQDTEHCINILNNKWYDDKCVNAWPNGGFICKERRTDLVVLFTGLTSNRIWISGHRIGRSTWLWINGDYILFTDWEIGEPSDQDTEHCINILNNKWHDDKCVNTWPNGGFICKERRAAKENEIEQRSNYHDDLFNMISLENTTGKLYLFADTAPPGNGTGITNYYPTENMTLVTLGPGNGTKYLFADQLVLVTCFGRQVTRLVVQLTYGSTVNLCCTMIGRRENLWTIRMIV
ncbi:hypothetical protein B566_EDAN015335 [Ephemera danica]|nr:hypothetical protein B566_EDAN015335 [Ephemera danica]